MSDKLQKYKDELAKKLVVKDELEIVANNAKFAYTTALQKWQEENKELVEAWNNTDNAWHVALKEFDTRRAEIRDELKGYFLEYPEDQKAIDAFGFRTEIDIHWVVDPKFHKLSIIQSLAQTAPFLLDIDYKAVLAYVKANAIEFKDSQGLHGLPVSIFAWHRKIFDAQDKIVPLVYDKYLVEDVSPKG